MKFSNSPAQMELVNGTISNLKITSVEGEEKQYAMIDDDNVLILPSEQDTVVEYDLQDAIFLEDNIWSWNFRYLQDTVFILPNEVDLIFVNNKPVYLDQMKGVKCHGCQMVLEYSIDEPRKIENVQWENKKFFVEIRSLAEINQFNFDQQTKNISFNVSGKNFYITAIIPQELLWGPYEVFLDDKKLAYSQYINNGTHVWVTMKPDNSGNVSIFGTTVIPEFPIITPLSLSFLMIIIFSIGINLHWSHKNKSHIHLF